MPPKERATKAEALEILYRFLTIDKTEHPHRYNRISLAKELRAKGYIVNQGLNRQLDEMCDEATYTKEYRDKWMAYIKNNSGL